MLRLPIAFIRFSKKAEADSAMAELNGYKLPGASRGLDVKVAEDHGRQKAAFYAGWLVGQGHGGRGGYGGRGGGGGYNSNFGLQTFCAPGANMRGVGGNRYNPISRGGYANHSQSGAGGPGKGPQGGYNPSGFSRG